jgi:nicotinate-nucleotide pyrophosphorylase (carboxylating)
MDIEAFIALAVAEDVGDGDHTSLACIPEDAVGEAKLLVKENGIIAGIELAQQIFHQIDPSVELNVLLKDGDAVSVGDIAFTAKGSSRSILKMERLMLNCMQRMSGIATQTHHIMQKLQGLPTKVLDTRKTTPGIRFMEKWAVKLGGGTNHRFGLYDMMMIKDNHIDYAGGIRQAIEAANAYLAETDKALKIEIEARNLQELDEILAVGQVDRIMLDNFNYADMRTAVEQIDGKYETEASGGITIETIREYAECGVDYISVGALTHTVKSLDLSLKAV